MGKSKFQNLAKKKVNNQDKNAKGRPKYYDENISSKKKNNVGFAIFIILTVVVAGSILGTIVHKENIAEQEEAREFLNPGYTYSDTETDSTQAPTEGIQTGDSVKLEYTLWIATPKSGPNGYVDTTAEPYQGPATFPATIQKGNLINGFYYNVLGMTEGETKQFSCPANIDDNGDGYDDITGDEVMSYASSGHDLYNTNLVFEVTVISID